MKAAGPAPGVNRLARALLNGAPLIAAGLLIAMIGLLFWYDDQQVRERERTSLVTDALWSEQALQFQLSADEDAIARMALEAGREGADSAPLRASLRHFMTGNPEVISVIWRNGDASLRLALPAGAEPPPAEILADAQRRESRASLRLRHTEPRPGADGAMLMDLVAPVAQPGGGGTGLLVATISLDSLLSRHLPWWISERYNVRLVDSAGRLLAAKPRNGEVDEQEMHAINFGPAIPGAMLHIAPRSKARASGSTLLIGTIAGLALISILSLILAHRHVRKRLDAEMALGVESAFRRAMEDSLTVGMRARDLDGRIIYVNPAFCRMVGMSAQELIGRAPPMPYWDPGDLEHTVAIHERVLQGQAPSEGFELRFRRANGTLFDVLIYEAPLIDASGRHAGWMASVLDITDRKRAEERAKAQEASLHRTARLVTMGEMASTLAHELNQPLAAIAGYGAGSLNLIRAGKADPAELIVALEKLGVQAQRAGLIIRRVHDFVRKSEPRIVASAPGPILRESVDFADTEARKTKVRIELDAPDDLPAIAVDPILIQQVLLNLIRNGAEAMAQARKPDRLLTLSARVEREGLAIRVEDRGTGVPDTLRERLFEPFVSTKPEGMGMGLNICRSIIELHKGRLTVAAREGGGTVFTMVLPLAETMERAS